MTRYILTFLLILAGYSLTAQIYNPVPQYVYKNKLGVGRSTAVDSAAYMNIGPNGGANAGVVLPRIADTLSILGTKRNGLLIFSNQLNKFAWWDSTGAKWTEVGSGSASTGEVMLINGSGTVGDSLLVSSVSGDTAYIKNIYAGNGIIIEPIGDTVLKINVDTSKVLTTTVSSAFTVDIGTNELGFTGTGASSFYAENRIGDSIINYIDVSYQASQLVTIYNHHRRGVFNTGLYTLKEFATDTLYPKIRLLGHGVMQTEGFAETTTGNKSKAEISGIVRIAAAGTAVTVTNPYVTTNTVVLCTLMTNDGTAWIKNVVPSSGSFTINLGAAATGEIRIGYVLYDVYGLQ